MDHRGEFINRIAVKLHKSPRLGPHAQARSISVEYEAEVDFPMTVAACVANETESPWCCSPVDTRNYEVGLRHHSHLSRYKPRSRTDPGGDLDGTPYTRPRLHHCHLVYALCPTACHSRCIYPLTRMCSKCCFFFR